MKVAPTLNAAVRVAEAAAEPLAQLAIQIVSTMARTPDCLRDLLNVPWRR